jgi:atypical dual specificity phosphatase
MSFFDKLMYSAINLSRNKNTIKIFNSITKNDNYNMIIPNLYLGNINCSNDILFLIENNIQGIVNCTIDEPFSNYFYDKNKIRLSINDSKELENIEKFKIDIINGINFIDNCINENKNVYVHCYFGLMRSATVVTGYLIKKYNIPYKDAINIVKEKRPMALSSLYNFNEVLEFVENKYLDKNKI